MVEPNPFAAERLRERPVRIAIIRDHARRQWLGPHTDDCLNVRRRPRGRLKLQGRLARCGQLDIDRGQQLGVEQSAVLRAARPINAVACAQIVER